MLITACTKSSALGLGGGTRRFGAACGGRRCQLDGATPRGNVSNDVTDLPGERGDNLLAIGSTIRFDERSLEVVLQQSTDQRIGKSEGIVQVSSAIESVSRQSGSISSGRSLEPIPPLSL
jgi:hypothetical protein